MATGRGLRPCVLPWILAALTALPTACGKPEPATARAAPPTTGSAAQTDDDLMAYVNWYRDWKQLTNRHKAEGDALMQSVAARYSFAETGNIAQDPDLLALLARQRQEMRPLMARAPGGPTAAAYEATLGGIGQLLPTPNGMVYFPGRNEAVLAAARARYGDKFVDWVLARESKIVATLGQ
jgi:hypothetical protein